MTLREVCRRRWQKLRRARPSGQSNAIGILSKVRLCAFGRWIVMGEAAELTDQSAGSGDACDSGDSARYVGHSVAASTFLCGPGSEVACARAVVK